ncbi:MAG: hypothetical protein JJT75_09415 [Opitutales bacterium]|nr:hypothetical protein [Opitutales bacterium]MCH8539906.1 hypothetical protein [Opitutales bacterium]
MARKKKQPEFEPWRQDFRLSAELPDIKPVKTNFMINVVATSLLSVLAIFFVIKNVETGRLQAESEFQNERIVELQPQSEEYQNLSRAFQEERKKLDEAYGFLEQTFSPSKVIYEFSRVVPARVQVNAFGWDGENITVSGHYLPDPLLLEREGEDEAMDEMLVLVRAFEEEVSEDEFWQNNFTDIEVGRVTQLPEATRVDFQLTMKLVEEE